MLVVQALSTARFSALSLRVVAGASRRYSTPANIPDSKVWASVDDAVKDVKSGDVLLCGGKWNLIMYT